jgi:hypothetical protein
MKNAPFQEDTAAAFKTLETDIRAKSDYLPVITATGVNFFEPDNVT